MMTLGIVAIATMASSGCGEALNEVGGGGGSYSTPGSGGPSGAPATPSSSPSSSAGAAGDTLGATPGGAQDIGYARTLIASGQVPPADSITVEGLLSEHDLPVTGAPCEDLLCARPAMGYAPALDTGENEYWLQLGLLSGLTADTFKRPPVDLAIVIDRSGSMSIDMAETAHAVNVLISKLREDDRLAVVAFNGQVDVLRQMGPPTNKTALQAQVTALQAQGPANLMDGLQKGYELVDAEGETPHRMRRVVVLSCGYPSAGNTGPASFQALVAKHAEHRIGLTFIGVLLNFDYMLADALSQEKGGNYFYTTTRQEVMTVFDAELDYVLTPLAYDLHFALEVPDGFELVRMYGLPGDPEGLPSSLIDVKTAFISKNKGAALIARLRRVPGVESGSVVAQVGLTYTPEPAHGWTSGADVQISMEDKGWDDVHHFDGPGVRKGVALVNQAQQMKAAIEAHSAGDATTAAALLTELLEYLTAEAVELPGLGPEVSLVKALLALI